MTYHVKALEMVHKDPEYAYPPTIIYCVFREHHAEGRQIHYQVVVDADMRPLTFDDKAAAKAYCKARNEEL